MFNVNHIVVADSSPLFRAATKKVISDSGIQASVTEADDFKSFLDVVTSEAFTDLQHRDGTTLLVVDRGLPGLKRFDQLTAKRAPSRFPVIILADETDSDFLLQAKANGIAGVINKAASASIFMDAFRAVAKGRRWYCRASRTSPPPLNLESLSRKQSLVLHGLTSGMNNKQIAAELNIADATVRLYVSQIYRVFNLDCPSRARLVSLALKSIPSAEQA